MELFNRLAPLVALVFLLLLFLQFRFPLRRPKYLQVPRCVRNLFFALPAFVALRFALIPIPLAATMWARTQHLGIFNWLELPIFLQVLCGVLAMDYVYYWWHYATHHVPLLWRFHNVHHTDLDLDVSTAARFHVGEILLSIAFRVAVVLLFGVAPLAVIVFEIVFETATQFHHSNWRLPLPVEQFLNRIFVTPRMHGIHHSVVRDQTDSNWGTIFSLWDKLHRTSRLDIPQDSLTIGSPDYHQSRELTVVELWQLPFRKS